MQQCREASRVVISEDRPCWQLHCFLQDYYNTVKNRKRGVKAAKKEYKSEHNLIQLSPMLGITSKSWNSQKFVFTTQE